ncbi:MAG: hypothetical protein C4294_09815 [Nitrospiraceae bacterium]
MISIESRCQSVWWEPQREQAAGLGICGDDLPSYGLLSVSIILEKDAKGRLPVEHRRSREPFFDAKGVRMTRLLNKVALITGAASGIGKPKPNVSMRKAPRSS